MQDFRTDYDRAVAALTGPGAPWETVQQTLGGVPLRVFRNAPPSLGALYQQATAHGEREFLLYQGERWGFARMLGQGGAIAARLAAEGIAPGDRVAIAMRNYPEWMSAFIGITALGAVAVPLNSWGTAADIAWALQDCGARLAFCDRPRAEGLGGSDRAEGCAVVVARAGAAPLPAGQRSLEEFLGGCEQAPLPAPTAGPDDPAMIMYTSGTTGKPKGAVSTQRAITQSILAIECSGAASAMLNPQAIAAMQASGLPPVHMLVVPLFHVSGCHAVFLGALRAGRRLVMPYKWDVVEALRLIAEEKVTILSAAPSMLQQLLESPLFAETDTSSLASVGAGGAASPPRLARLIEERVANPYPGTGWGMTESNACGTAFTGDPFRVRPDAAGFPQAVVDIEARSPEGEALPPGVPGTLWLRSPTLVSGYWNRPEATTEAFRDGWFDSGDIGCIDASGYLVLSDRAKDLVIRGGENIYPAEVESALMEHPEVEEIAAFGVPDEALGERLAVAVCARPGSTLDEAGLLRFAAQKLAHFKVPEQVWLRRQPLPRNAAGKVVKPLLRQQFAAREA